MRSSLHSLATIIVCVARFGERNFKFLRMQLIHSIFIANFTTSDVNVYTFHSAQCRSLCFDLHYTWRRISGLQFPVTFYWQHCYDTCARDIFQIMFLFQRHYYRLSHVSMSCPKVNVFDVVIGGILCKTAVSRSFTYFSVVN
jgi:hypothetical protein